MVFQDPMLTLNPTIPVGKQITEAIIKNQKVSRDEAKKRAVEMLKLVGIPDAEQRYGLQPHFFPEECVSVVCWLLHWPVIRKYYLPMSDYGTGCNRGSKDSGSAS